MGHATIRRKLAIICAILGAAFSFIATQPDFVRSAGRTFSFPASKTGINLITLSTYNPYRTIKEVRTFGSNNYFCLDKLESGYSFVKRILQKIYYKDFEKDILLFISLQRVHVENDADNPETTYRPIYAIPQNTETEDLNSARKQAHKENGTEKLDIIMAKLMQYKKFITTQNGLIATLDDYYKTNILFIATLFIVFSILLNGNHQNYSKKGETHMKYNKLKQYFKPSKHIIIIFLTALALVFFIIFVRNKVKNIEQLYSSMAGALTAFGGALVLYELSLHIDEKSKKTIKNDNTKYMHELYKMELTKNISHIKHMIDKKWIPYYRLKTVTRDKLWGQLADYSRDLGLMEKFNETYAEFELINNKTRG